MPIDSEKLIALLLAYLHNQPDNIPKIAQLSKYEWEAWLNLAIKHGVAPLLYHRFTNLLKSQVPETILTELRKAYHRNVFRNVQYYQELSEILKQLQHHGIDVIVLKGAYLAKTVYQSEALRIIGDIDLLVKPDDLAKTETILLNMGYGPTNRPSIEEQCVISHHLIPFKKLNAITIEIHWNIDLLMSLKIKLDSLWESAYPFTVAGVPVLSLSPENLLLHLCIHTAYNGNLTGMRFFCDINHTIHYYQDNIDWNLLFHRAKQWQAEKQVYIALYLAKDGLAAQVPKIILEQFKPNDFNLELVAKEIININVNSLSHNFAALWMPNKPFLEKLSLILKNIFPSPNNLARIYAIPENSLRVYCYYPVRLIEHLFRYGGKVWRMLHGDKETVTLTAQSNKITLLKNWIESK